MGKIDPILCPALNISCQKEACALYVPALGKCFVLHMIECIFNNGRDINSAPSAPEAPGRSE